uniref:Uncharacterized protein n=1 Tax=Urocitellus parryii TaxID=9999 RepID=A0A8D2KNI8_UROPR
MKNCAVYVDKCSLQHSARLDQEVLECSGPRRAVDWHSQKQHRDSFPGRVLPRNTTGSRSPVLFSPGEREERYQTLSASFRTVAEFMDFKSVWEILFFCGRGKRDNPCLSLSQREVAATHVLLQKAWHPSQPRTLSKDLYIKVYPGTYSVIVGSTSLTKKIHVVGWDPGQSSQPC